jgi:hypothetical protein
VFRADAFDIQSHTSRRIPGCLRHRASSFTQDRRILTLERRVGFRFEWGLSRKTGESLQIPGIGGLLAKVDALKERYVDYEPSRLRSTLSFEDNCNCIFAEFAPKVWPRLSTDRDAWLVRSESNSWNNLYNRDLEYFEPEDEKVLREGFHRMCFLTYMRKDRCYRMRDDSFDLSALSERYINPPSQPLSTKPTSQPICLPLCPSKALIRK